MKLKGIIRSEEEECIALVAYLDMLQNQKKITMYTHIPNETYTVSWNQKRKNKAMGVRRGFPDYVIVTPRVLIFLEMKREHGGVVSPAQREWVEALDDQSNTFARVCNGFRDAETVLKKILN